MLTAALFLTGCDQKIEDFNFPEVNPDHEHIRLLLANAMSYINPEHRLIEPVSGYPVEGWNQDVQLGLHLRSFTQLTSIGEWAELLANIAAGYADNPYLSRGEALDRLSRVVDSLLADQSDPELSAKGLLGNFLGLTPAGRLGPLCEAILREDLTQAFGEEKASRIWDVLTEMEWIKPVRGGIEAQIQRGPKFGSEYFTDRLEEFSDTETKKKIMDILDERVVKVVFGDNVNLTASLAKSIGALLSPAVKDNPQAVKLRVEMERFIAAQEEGYRHLHDPETDTFIFGWNVSKERFVGWEDGKGNWVVGHQNYFPNEFRGPFTFVHLRYGLPLAAIRNCGLFITPYQMRDGRDLYTLKTWSGSAFQSWGLTLFMQEYQFPGWWSNLENAVDIAVDFAERHGNPGFLSESYSGNDTEYTGETGIPDIAVAKSQRIIDAPSLYTLGTAYSVFPEKIEKFLADHWSIVSGLLTEHGPWEGYKTSRKEAIEFQTSAHTLSLILGGICTAQENMRRYLESRGLVDDLEEFNAPGDSLDILARPSSVITWTPGGENLESSWKDGAFCVRGDSIPMAGITIEMPGDRTTNLSNGTFRIEYRADEPVTKARIEIERHPVKDIAPMVFKNTIHVRFPESAGKIEIPLPGTPGLGNVKELVVLLGDGKKATPVNLTIKKWEYLPGN